MCNCWDDFVVVNFMLFGIFFLINLLVFINMCVVGVCLCNIMVFYYRLILFLDRKFYMCWLFIIYLVLFFKYDV